MNVRAIVYDVHIIFLYTYLFISWMCVVCHRIHCTLNVFALILSLSVSLNLSLTIYKRIFGLCFFFCVFALYFGSDSIIWQEFPKREKKSHTIIWQSKQSDSNFPVQIVINERIGAELLFHFETNEFTIQNWAISISWFISLKSDKYYHNEDKMRLFWVQSIVFLMYVYSFSLRMIDQFACAHITQQLHFYIGIICLKHFIRK